MIFLLFISFFSFSNAAEKDFLHIKCADEFVKIHEKHISYELLILLETAAIIQQNRFDESVQYSFFGNKEELEILIESYKNLKKAESRIRIINYVSIFEFDLEKFEEHIKKHAIALINIIKEQNIDLEVLQYITHEKIRNKINLSFVSPKDLRNILCDYLHRLELGVDEITDTLFCEKFLIITQDMDIMYHQKYKTSIYDFSCKKIIKKFFHKNKKLFFNNDKTKVIGEGFNRTQIIIDLDTLEATFFNHESEELVDIIQDIQIVQTYGPSHNLLIRKNGIELFCFTSAIYKNKNKDYGGFSIHNGEYNVFSQYNGQNIVFLQNNIFYVIKEVFPEFIDLNKIELVNEQDKNLLKFYLSDREAKKIICYSTSLVKHDNHQDIEVKECFIGHKISKGRQWQESLKPLAKIPFGYDSYLLMGKKAVCLLENNNLLRIRTYKNNACIIKVYNNDNNIIKSFYNFGENLYHTDLNDIYQPSQKMVEKHEKNNLKIQKILQAKKENKKQELEQKSKVIPKQNYFQQIKKIPISLLWLIGVYICTTYLRDYTIGVIRKHDRVLVGYLHIPLRSFTLIAFWSFLIIFRIWNDEVNHFLNNEQSMFWEKKFANLSRIINNCFSGKKNSSFEEKFQFFCKCFKKIAHKKKINKTHCSECNINLLFASAIFAVDNVKNGYVTKQEGLMRFKQLTYFMVENSLLTYKNESTRWDDSYIQEHLQNAWPCGTNLSSKAAESVSFLKYVKKLFDTKEDYKEFKNNIVSKSNHNAQGGFLCWKF